MNNDMKNLKISELEEELKNVKADLKDMSRIYAEEVEKVKKISLKNDELTRENALLRTKIKMPLASTQTAS